MYIKPEIIEIKAEELNKYIVAAATSICWGASADYTIGGGCGYLYAEGGCPASHNS